MSRLLINFGHFTADSADAVVPVDVIDHNLNQIWARPSMLGQTISVDVEPGSYLVRLHLPSGETASAQASVLENEAKTVRLMPATESPRETLSWAYYLKSAFRTESPHASELFRSVGARSPSPPPEVKFWAHRLDEWHELSANAGGGNLQRISINFDSSVQLDDARALLAITLQSEYGPRFDLGQLWLQVRHRNISQFVALPPGLNMRVLILDGESTATCIVDSGNPRAEALLGYLISGDYVSARAVSEETVQYAERLLHDKTLDPGQAAIGAYYLLRAGHLDRLHGWTKNLANWIPWMPDGAVIRAWHLLRERKPNPEHALAWFLEAEQRGIPLYAQGLRLLFDGLRLFEARLPEEGGPITMAVDRLRPYLAASRQGFGTTCFFGEFPGGPMTPQDLEEPAALQPALAVR